MDGSRKREEAMKPRSRKPDGAADRPKPARPRKAAKAPIPTDDDIARRAYERFLERGAEHGRDWEDWLVAEQELRRSGD
jgi:hypothetical protein